MTITKMETRMKRMEEQVKELAEQISRVQVPFSYGDLITTAHIAALDRDNKIVGMSAPVEVQWRGPVSAVREGTYPIKMHKTTTVVSFGLMVAGRVVNIIPCPMKPTFADTSGMNTLNVVMEGFRNS